MSNQRLFLQQLKWLSRIQSSIHRLQSGFTMKKYFSLMPAIFLITSCGGGSVTEDAPLLPILDGNISLNYIDPKIKDNIYTPWDKVQLEPVLVGSVPSSRRLFTFNRVAAEINSNPDTGVISGYLPLKPREINPFVLTQVLVGFEGYRGQILSNVEIRGNYFSDSEPWNFTNFTDFVRNGDDGWRGMGVVGLNGYIKQEPKYYTYYRDAITGKYGTVADTALPPDVSIIYGLTNKTTAAGASMNTSSGLISWKPSAPGSYDIQWYADLKRGDVTRRYISEILVIDIN